MFGSLLILSIVFIGCINAQVTIYGQCGGDAYFGSNSCNSGLTCFKKDRWYSQCLTACNDGWECTVSVDSSKAEVRVGLYGQCGGDGYSGSTVCDSGLQCYKQHQYYSQCLTSCPSGWDCNNSGGTTSATSQTTVQSSTNGGTSITPTSGWPGCSFKFGMAFTGNNGYDYDAVDHLSIWVGSPSSTHGTNFNPYWHGEMLKTAVKYGKTPIYYGYIIAFMARDEWGLQDCDVGTPSLCQKGSDYIRAKRAEIVAKYKHYAAESAKIIGRTGEIIWLIEPDFWQYYGDVTHQQNGALSGPYMRQLFDDIALAIKSELPNAKISWDISAWLTEAAMTTWWGFFASSPHVNFIHTSGGQSRPDIDQIKQNELKWAFMSILTGKKIIADTGYGVAGGSTGHNSNYDNITNLNARIKNGVVAVTQANPRADWRSVLNTVRPQLLKTC